MELTPGQDWFDGQRPVWEQIVLPRFAGRTIRAIELGSWEGASACWILANLCGGASAANHLICIDHFDLGRTSEGLIRRRRMQSNLRETGLEDRVEVVESFTIPALFELMRRLERQRSRGFDFAYIDASHRSDDTMLDAELVWRCLEEGAVLIFDDYEWPEQPLDSALHPSRGIDAFLSVHAGEFVPIHRGYQIIIEKTVPLRLGFLTSTDQ